MMGIFVADVLPQVLQVSGTLFYILHPAHIILSAAATTTMYRLQRHRFRVSLAVLIGWVGSIGIATISDSLIPYVGEWLLDLPNRGVHIGFIEEPWFTNGAAFAGIAIAFLRPIPKFPHFGHVLISTWASLFHIIMALGQPVGWIIILAVLLFLFLAVWIPCCTSDIVFPLLFVPVGTRSRQG